MMRFPLAISLIALLLPACGSESKGGRAEFAGESASKNAGKNTPKPTAEAAPAGGEAAAGGDPVAPAADQGDQGNTVDNGFQLTSTAYVDSALIPMKNVGDCGNVKGDVKSPPLKWSTPPEGTKFFAIIIEGNVQQDAGAIRWAVLNIPATTRELAADMSATQTRNEDGLKGAEQTVPYKGFCPTKDTSFQGIAIFALKDKVTAAAGGADTPELATLSLGTAQLIGKLEGVAP